MIPLEYLSLALVGFNLIWTAVLTVVFFQTKQQHQKLIGSAKKKDIISILTTLMDTVKKLEHHEQRIDLQMISLENKLKNTINKIGFIRFNPFSDTGGNQSFIMSLLNGNKSGMIISSLHNRDITRVYAKKVTKGKGEELELSEEEKQVVDNAEELKA